MKRLLGIVISNIGKTGVVNYLALGLLSGFNNFLFINLITRIIDLLISGEYTAVSKEYVIIFSAIILLIVWTRRGLSLIIITLSQKIVWQLRLQILRQVLNANYQQMSARKDRISAAILHDVGALSNASMSVIDFFIAATMIISCFVYLALISMVLFFITLVVASIGVWVYLVTTRRNTARIAHARKLENNFQENFRDILNGFKEIFMEPKKGKYIFEEKVLTISGESYRNNTSALIGFLNNSIIGQILFNVLITSVILFFSVVLSIKPGDAVSFTFTLLYLLGSIQSIMGLIPVFARSGVASNHLLDLKKELEEANFKNPIPEKYYFRWVFDHISVKDLRFSYDKQDSSFAVGPVNMEIKKGEVVFIYGGNGSGKTTVVNTVLGICFPTAGEIRVNNTLIDDENYPDYRSLFAVVFSDFYLFKEIIGLDNFDVERCKYFLRLFELDDKVSVEGRSFSSVNLSTGQRKRLALIAALMEEKPVLVLDEWAADQDPHFRMKFYTEIIPLLKNEGKTILAITHDDKYYYCADKLYKMDEGLISEEIIESFHPAGSFSIQ